MAAIATVAVLGLTVPPAAAATPPASHSAAHQATSTPKKAGPGLPKNQRPITPPVVPGPPKAKPATKPAPVNESTAVTQAKATGQPVEVTADTTPNTDVVANANGTFTMTSTLQPTRTEQNGDWVPIDPTLHKNPDGSLSPNATTQNITFSGGGTQPMIAMTSGTVSLSLAWPGPLPTPQMSGPRATYPGVLPGVDLELTATATGYQEVLIVHDAAAAANPALAAIHLTTTAVGLTVRADANNLLTATDATGKVVFRSATPLMWDSTAGPSGAPAPSATDPGSGKITELAVTASSSSAPSRAQRTSDTAAATTTVVTVSPPPSALTGPGVAYPIYIDPQLQSGSQYWVEVTSNKGTQYDPAHWAQVGDCGNWSGCNGLGIARSYFVMPTPDLDNPNSIAHVWSANFTITEMWNAADCTDESVSLYQSGYADSNTTWPGPVNLNAELDRPFPTNVGAGCPNSTEAEPYFDVTGYAGAAAAGHWPNLTMAMVATNEGDQNDWKQFNVADRTPELTVNYSYPPNPATGLTADTAVNCTGTSYLPVGQAHLNASATDNNNPPLPLTLHFDVSDNNFAGNSGDIANDGQAGAGGAGWPINATLAPGNYQARVAVENNYPGGQYPNLFATDGSGNHIYDYYDFTQLAVPAQTPAIGTGQYPEGYWGEPSNNPGAFGITDPGANNIAGFAWTIDGTGSEPVPPTTDCDYSQSFTDPSGNVSGGFVPNLGNSSASFAIPAGLSVGYHVMYTRAFDYAHNLSPESQPYVFYVAAPLQSSASHWSEAEASGAYSQPAGQNVALAPQSNCCGVVWNGGAQLLFGGTAAGQSFSVQFTSTLAANYELESTLTKAPDYGILSMTLDGTPVNIDGSSQFDGYSPTVTTSYVGIGAVYLPQGPHTITVTMVGTNPASTGNRYIAGVDGFWLQAANQLNNITPVSQASPTSPIGVQATDTSGQHVTPAIEQNDNGVAFPNGAQLLYPATAAGQSVTLSFQTPVEADYALGALLSVKSNYGQLEFTVDGPANGTSTGTVLESSNTTPVDTYSSVEYGAYEPLGGLHLAKGTHTLTLTVTGKNASSSGYQIGVEDLTLAVINNVTADNFADAMNNRGIATDHGPAGVDFDGWAQGLSATAMAQAGIAPGSSFTTGGATFPLPAEGTYTTAGTNTSTPLYDNVVAYGQTIPLPTSQQVQTSTLGFLVSSTCGWSPEARAIITYQTGVSTTPMFPRVPDWLYGDDNSATITTPYVELGGSQPSTDHRGHLYAVFLPTDPTRALKSVTLPYTGSAGLDNTCNGNSGSLSATALHVFAIAPRPAAYDNSTAAKQSWLAAFSAPTDAAVLPPGGQHLNGQTLRMIVHPTSQGSDTRIRLSNLDVDQPATISAATIAAQSGTTGTTPGTLTAPTPLTFSGHTSITMPSGADIASDPVTFPGTSGGTGNLIVSLYFASPMAKAPVHTTLSSTTFLATGNDTANTDGTPFGPAITGDYFLTGVDISTASGTANQAPTGTVAVIGDQTSLAGATGGSCGGGTNYACTWVDDLATTPGITVPGTVVNASKAGTPAQDQWKLDDGAGTLARDTGSADPANPATVTGGVTWNTGPSGSNGQTGSVTLDGTGSLATSGTVLNTTDSFTVSAWVDPTQLGSAAQTFIAQQGTDDTGFDLGYDPSTGGGVWSFSRVESDTMNPTTIDKAESSSPASPQRWTHLVGEFNDSIGTLSLYVNGTLVSTVVDNSPVATSGPLVIGHGFVNGAAANYVTGSIANVQVFQRVLQQSDISQLWNPIITTPQPAPFLGAPSPATIGATSGTNTQTLPTSPATVVTDTIGSDPNIRTVIVSLGANDVLNGFSKDTIEQNITAMIDPLRGFGLKHLVRADGLSIHVLLTTIPPLGLPPATQDHREQVREDINNDILNRLKATFDADGAIDFDGAVTSSTAGQVNPTCLANGTPNASYYQDLANAVVNAENTVPPTAQL